MTITTLLQSGRASIAAKRKDEADRVWADTEAQNVADLAHWQALCACIRSAIPECLHGCVNFDLDIELERADAEEHDAFHGQGPHHSAACDRFTLRINVPNCTDIETRFYVNRAGLWEHWVVEKPSVNHATYRVSVYAKDLTRADESHWYVYPLPCNGSIWTSDLAEAFAHAEEAYRARNLLLAECEKANAEIKANTEQRRFERSVKLTTAEVLVEALRAFIAEQLPEQE